MTKKIKILTVYYQKPSQGSSPAKIKNKAIYLTAYSFIWYTFSLSSKKSRWDFDCEESLSKKPSEAQADWCRNFRQTKKQPHTINIRGYFGTPSGTQPLRVLPARPPKCCAFRYRSRTFLLKTVHRTVLSTQKPSQGSSPTKTKNTAIYPTAYSCIWYTFRDSNPGHPD